jgi:carbamoyltransferase
VIAGISGGRRNANVALGAGGSVVGVCPQERATRMRGAGVNGSGLPDEALDLLLERLGRSRAEVGRFVVADAGVPVAEVDDDRFAGINHHFAHACTAYYTSPFDSAAVVICDHDSPEVSVWTGQGSSLTRVDWPWQGPGFAQTFSRFSAALGFAMAGADQRAEALARLRPDSRDPAIDGLLRLGRDGIAIDPALERYVAERLAGERETASPARAKLAASLHASLADLLVAFLHQVREQTSAARLCLGGTLFYHSSVNTRVKGSGLFGDVFLPVDPGDSGLAVGAALHALGRAPMRLSPFLGPSYSAEETKNVLDNCKLQYSWESEEGAIEAAVDALLEGRLVGWFDGSMEWGQRALGARCILANPTAPYVLENLNRFLKHRDHWRGYALSGLRDAVPEHFDGPAHAPFMECDYRPRDVARFREALPSAEAAVRVHTVSADDGLPEFRRLLEAFGEASGLPFLVNTSFNGFHEPIVCSPRDAVRVFYGTGLDLLVMNQFVLRK